jgi:exonuclease III
MLRGLRVFVSRAAEGGCQSNAKRRMVQLNAKARRGKKRDANDDATNSGNEGKATSAREKEADNGPESTLNQEQATSPRKKQAKQQSKEKTRYPRSQTPRAHPPSDNELTVVTYNVSGLRAVLRDESKQKLLSRIVEEEHPDVLFFSETKINPSDEATMESKLAELLPLYTFVWSTCTAKKGYSGTCLALRSPDNSSAVYVSEPDQNNKSRPRSVSLADSAAASRRNPLPSALWEGLPDGEYVSEGRVITAEYDDFYLVLSYTPNSGQTLNRLTERINEWEMRMRAYLNELQQRKCVLYGGDLNVAPLDSDIWNYDAKHIAKSAGTTPSERNAYAQMLDDCGLVDCFRYLFPDASGVFSYWCGCEACLQYDIHPPHHFGNALMQVAASREWPLQQRAPA